MVKNVEHIHVDIGTTLTSTYTEYPDTFYMLSRKILVIALFDTLLQPKYLKVAFCHLC